MTEEISAAPGWVEKGLDDAFKPLPRGDATDAAKEAYLLCLSRRKNPGQPSETLGAEFSDCRPALRQSLMQAGVQPSALARLETALEALEAEIAAAS